MSRNNRVVVTGLGVISPNGAGVAAFNQALQAGISGIEYFDHLKELNLRCQIGGKVNLEESHQRRYLSDFFSGKIKSNAVIYACLAGMEAWQDAGLEVGDEVDWDAGMVFGAGDLSFDDKRKPEEVPTALIDSGNAKRLGSRALPECMNSGASAYLNNLLGVGNRVISNSSACITGSEAVLLGYERIKNGQAKRMICGSTESDSKYIWAGFDSMRILCSDANENPEKGSRPMSASSAGFIPGGGSGALILETLESAQARGAKIYAEILGGDCNSGGQRNGGTMTAPNSVGVVQCIKSALADAQIKPEEVDLISGHLTSTKGDPVEVKNWAEALGREGADFPYINTPKSMIGHCIGAAGSIELVAAVLQLEHGYIHPNLNCEEIHPDIAQIVPEEKIPRSVIHKKIDTVIKSNFGFGDLNCVLVLRKWKSND